MSKEWNFHCKTCDREPEGFPGFNHGEDILRSMYKVRKHAYAIQEQDTKDIISGQIGYISVEVMGSSYTYVWQFLHEHEGHEVELLSEYGDAEPIESDGQMSNMKRLLEEMMEPDQPGHDGRPDSDYVIIGKEKYYPDQLRFFREAWQMLVEQHGHIPEMTLEQEAVARYLKLYPPSKVVDVEIDGKKYRGTVYLVEEQR